MNLSYAQLNHQAHADLCVDKLLHEARESCDTKFVILDDDPTGVQTIHDLYVYTDCEVTTLIDAFEDGNPGFFLLTNSRAFTQEETIAYHKKLTENVSLAAKATGKSYLYVSRGDSTLRGHYPLEPQILKEGLEKDGVIIDGEILYPFFLEGGRFTVDDVHYVKNGDVLIPAAQTEFALDKTFGYTHSDLKEYIEEKTEGTTKSTDVLSVPLDLLHNGKIDEISELLLHAEKGVKIVVNSIDYFDVKVFCIALYKALKAGKHFVFRTAASFVKGLLDVSDRPYLSRSEMVQEDSENGGVIVVGSHTQKTTRQLENLLTLEDTVGIAFRSSSILEGEEAFYDEVRRCVRLEEEIIRQGKNAVCYTERVLLQQAGDSKEEALLRSVKISDGVMHLVKDLNVTPAFVVAKGGITSSDVGVKALNVKKALVLGQILPGIPVWKTGEESRFPRIPYVIFPGNVGEAESLKEVVNILTDK